MAKHTLTVGPGSMTGKFMDTRADNYRRSERKHRADAPEFERTIYDMDPEELTSAKGAGGRY